MPVFVPRRQFEVHNASIGRQCRINPEIHAANHALVRPRIVASLNLDTDDLAECRGTYDDQKQRICRKRLARMVLHFRTENRNGTARSTKGTTHKRALKKRCDTIMARLAIMMYVT